MPLISCYLKAPVCIVTVVCAVALRLDSSCETFPCSWWLVLFSGGDKITVSVLGASHKWKRLSRAELSRAMAAAASECMGNNFLLQQGERLPVVADTPHSVYGWQEHQMSSLWWVKMVLLLLTAGEKDAALWLTWTPDVYIVWRKMINRVNAKLLPGNSVTWAQKAWSKHFYLRLWKWSSCDTQVFWHGVRSQNYKFKRWRHSSILDS